MLKLISTISPTDGFFWLRPYFVWYIAWEILSSISTYRWDHISHLQNISDKIRLWGRVENLSDFYDVNCGYPQLCADGFLIKALFCLLSLSPTAVFSDKYSASEKFCHLLNTYQKRPISGRVISFRFLRFSRPWYQKSVSTRIVDIKALFGHHKNAWKMVTHPPQR